MSFAVDVNSLLTSRSSISYFVVSQSVRMKPLTKNLACHWTSNT